MLRGRLRGIAVLALAAGLVAGTAAAQQPTESLTITYPEEGTVFPPGIVAPIIRWEDPSPADAWQVTIEADGLAIPISASVDARQWRPGSEQWAAVQAYSLEGARITVSRAAQGAPAARAGVTITTSPDPVDAPIFYREVPIPLEHAIANRPLIRWRLGEVTDQDEPRTVLEGMETCANCHSFSADGRTLAMDVDYTRGKDSYAITAVEERTTITEDDLISWADYYGGATQRRTFGLLPRVSPDGRWVISTVDEKTIHVPLPDLYCSQLFFPIQGVLVVYDREGDTFRALPGADDKAFAHTSAAWSPDGSEVIFARAPAHQLSKPQPREDAVVPRSEAQVFVSGEKKFRFDLYRVPFNGGEGGEARPVEGAHDNGKSNYFARYSPDGEWIVFCQADSFLFNRPDATLFIMPSSGGTPRRMRCNRPGRMNSWHSWSPSGRWMVFSSKANGPYTQLWLTHIDEQGDDSPPVLLEGFTPPDRAANLPEFVDIEPHLLQSIEVSDEIREFKGY